jgi:hypothetical protein
MERTHFAHPIPLHLLPSAITFTPDVISALIHHEDSLRTSIDTVDIFLPAMVSIVMYLTSFLSLICFSLPGTLKKKFIEERLENLSVEKGLEAIAPYILYLTFMLSCMSHIGMLSSISPVLHSNPIPTFSLTSPSVYTPSYETPNTWDCITIISNFPDTVPAHPFDILPCLAPEPFELASLLCSWPYSTHRFTEFCPYRTDRDPTELRLTPRPHKMHVHTLEHSTFCYEHVCPTHHPYGGNKQAK